MSLMCDILGLCCLDWDKSKSSAFCVFVGVLGCRKLGLALSDDCIVGVVGLQETFLEHYICVFSGCLWPAPLPKPPVDVSLWHSTLLKHGWTFLVSA